jgi:hypothetical protein
MGLGHALEVAHQEVVQALAGGFFIDLDQPHGRLYLLWDGRWPVCPL